MTDSASATASAPEERDSADLAQFGYNQELKRSLEVNYHLSSLPRVLPWLRAFRAASAPERRAETARLMRPLMAQAVSEHEALMAESGARRKAE